MTPVKGHRRKGKPIKAHQRKQAPKGWRILQMRKYARQEQFSHHQQKTAPYSMQYDKTMVGPEK